MKYVALSLGWGVQSFTLAAMSALGELPMVDVAIHADTTHERAETYNFAEKYNFWLKERGINVVTVSDVGATSQVWDGSMIPAFTVDELKIGQSRRSCTGRWKIQPIRKWLQSHRDKRQVEFWMGITTDEITRMKQSNVKYIVNRYPLIEKRMSRGDCILWLARHDLDIPVSSSCVFCPYHSTKTWNDIRNNSSDWSKAISVDREIRNKRPPYKLYLHRSLEPLESANINTQQDEGQLVLWQDECEGICGL